MNSESPRPNVDQHVFLIGRPPLPEYLGFIKALAVDGQSMPTGPLIDEWRIANDHVAELEKREAGLADNPPMEELPKKFQSLIQRVITDPMFQQSYQSAPTDIRLVELDRLVVFQKVINLNYVALLKTSLGSRPSEEQVFQCCLPFDHPHPPVQMMQTAQNGFTFLSQSSDIRFLDAALLRPNQLLDYRPQGPISAVLGLVVGFGSNFLNAIQVENRLILSNGSHRAFALRDIGVTHVPCIIQKVSRREELAIVANPEVVSNPDRYLKVARPPLLKDYFDPVLRKIVPVPRKNRLVRVSYVVEQSDIPAAM